MKLAEYFINGGAEYMAVISICGLLMMYFSVRKIIRMVANKEFDLLQLNYILLFGSLAAIIGFLAQGTGLFQGMEAIHQAGDISPSLMTAGFQISMIAPLYGIILFVISLLFWGILKEINIRKMR